MTCHLPSVFNKYQAIYLSGRGRGGGEAREVSSSGVAQVTFIQKRKCFPAPRIYGNCTAAGNVYGTSK